MEEVIIVDKRNELLFWKVFRNKYLFSKIIQTIQNTEWYDYTDPNQIRHDNRILFKNITSLQWFIDKKQLQLLKCKLIAGEHINVIGVYYLQSLIHGVGGDNDQIFSDQCKESLELLLKYQSSQIEKFNRECPLIPIALKYKIFEYGQKLPKSDPDLDVIKIFVNNLKSYTPDPKEIEWVVCNSTIEILDTLINVPQFNSTILPKEIKDKLISMAFKNSKNKEEMVRYVINNPSLYSVPLLNGKFGLNEGEITKIDLVLLLSSYPLDIQVQLINNLNYFKFSSNFDTNHKEEIIKIMTDDKIKNKAKEVHRLLVLKKMEPIISLYCSFVVNYNEIINELDIDEPTKESAENYLKHIKFFQTKSGSKHIPNLSTMDKELFFKFMQIYTSSFNLNVLGENESDVMEMIFKLNKQDYESLIQLIKPTLSSKFINRFPTSWNIHLPQLLKKSTFTISNEQTINWIYENSDLHWPEFEYSSCKLLEYAFAKFSSIKKLTFSRQSRLTYPFIKALSNCDIIELEAIGKISNSKQLYQMIPKDKLQFKNQLSSNIALLTEYLNKNTYLLGENCDLFIKQLLETIKDPEFKLQHIKLDPVLFPTLNNCLQKELLNPIDLKRIKLLFENNQFPSSILKGYTEDISGLKMFTQTIIGIKNKSQQNLTVEGIISCIEIVINQFNIQSRYGNQDNLKILENLINYQYRQLLGLRPVPLDRLKYIYKLIIGNQSSIELKHSLYTSFHYICIKSTMLEKYILGQPFLFGLNEKYFQTLSDRYGYYETYGSKYSYKGYDISKYLDPTIFTFDYLFWSGASFDDILEKLVHHLSHMPGCTDKEMVNYEGVDTPWERDIINYYFRSLNHNLVYFLEIKRVDLFHKEYNLFKDFEKSFIKLHETDVIYRYFNIYPSDKVLVIAKKTLDRSTYNILKMSVPKDPFDGYDYSGEENGIDNGNNDNNNYDDTEDDPLGL